MKPLYVETDASRVGLRAVILQARVGTGFLRDEAPDRLRQITFASNSLSAAERRYSNIEREALVILHSLEGGNYNTLTTKRDVATLSQRLQPILH